MVKIAYPGGFGNGWTLSGRVSMISGAPDFCVGKMKSCRDKVMALLGARVFRPAWFPERVVVVSELQNSKSAADIDRGQIDLQKI